MTDAPDQASPPLDPDVGEEELASEIDNSVPALGYRLNRVVGLGGSAGGIVALRDFFQAMPADTGMAFVVVLHLSPVHDSVLSEILQRSSSMKVTQAENLEKVLPNHVYVIPPGKQISLTNGQLRLADLPREPGRRMTVDLFFRSLADTHGPHAVAIVLSGGDGDGAIGIKRIKERGGLTIAQDPAAAEHPSMPRAAIATTMVDWILRAQDMPRRIVEYHVREQRLQLPPEAGPNPVVAPTPAVGAAESALREVLEFVHDRTGRDFSYYKRATIVRRIARRMQVNELDDLPSYVTFLRTHPGESGALLQDLLISVTNFFRDREAFQALERLIPELFRDKTQSDTLRVWVPACASGEEAYSIAIMLTEHARLLDAPPTLQIFATDLDEDVLKEARAGFYPNAISTDVSPERLRRFFVKEPHGYRVRRDLRENLLFASHDLLKDSPFSRLDLVSCRNLLIYLNRDAQRRAFDIFHFALRGGGRLFLGTSESAEDAGQLFRTLDKKHRLYSRQPSARASLPVPAGPSTLARALAVQERGVPIATLATRQVEAATHLTRPGAPEHASWSELHLKLVERLGPPSAVVDAEYDILHLSESFGAFIQFQGGEPSRNLLRVIHPVLRVELRAALFRAKQTGQAASAQGLPIELAGSPRVVNLRVTLVGELASELFLVSLEPQPLDIAAVKQVEPDDEPLVRHLERELEQTKQHLSDVFEQHEASTEELKASNEELQAINEELRSATEELETSREELQSINEELTTVNHQLKTNVEELGHANGDLHNLMGATAIATVFLDRELRIMRFTPPAVELFSLIDSDIGRPLSDLQHTLAYPELLSDAARVLQQLAPVERQVNEPAGERAFLSRLLPYRTHDDRIGGVVLTFVDVTERQMAQAALQRAQQDLELRVVERTAELDSVNATLREEVQGHERAERARQDLQRRLVHAQEAERARISRELHDEVGQQLSALMLSLGALETAGSDGEVANKLKELRGVAEQVAKEVHQIAVELRPVALDELGLAGALSSFLETWSSRTGIAVDCIVAGLDEERLPPQIETTLYRIVQEAMNNVYKHAQAQSVSVSIEKRAGQVIAIVEDDGVGFDVDHPPVPTDSAQIGIAGMRERADIVGAELSFDSAPGSGTTLRVKLPVPGN